MIRTASEFYIIDIVQLLMCANCECKICCSSLREDCLKPDTEKDKKNEEKSMKVDEDETRAITSAPESETEIVTKSVEFHPKIDKQTMLDIQEQRQKNQENYSTIIQRNPEIIASFLENNSEILMSTTEKPSSLNAINKTKLQDVINFWKMFTTSKYKDHTNFVTKRTRTTEKSQNVSSENPIVVHFERSSKEVNIINKLLADYFDKTIQPSTTEKTIISNVDLSNLYRLTQQFENFMKIISQSNKMFANTNNNKLSLTNNTSKDDNFRNNNNIPQQTLIMRASKKKYIETNSKKHSISDISNLLLFNDQLKRSFAITNETYSPSYQMQEMERSKNNQEFYNTKTTKYVNTDFNQQEINVFSKDMMKKIAENVKAIVLKDLRQEIISTTSTYASTLATTETSVTTKNTSSKSEILPVTVRYANKTAETNQVLKNIMELVKELKDLKDKTVSITSTTTESIEKFDTENVYVSNRLLNQHSLPIQMMNPYVRKKPQKIKSFYKTYEPRSITGSQAPLNNINQARMRIDNVPNFIPNKKISESTIIQTNSGEIPPLGVPVSKPLQLIHQNIVVTTAPLAKTLHSSELWASHHTKTNDRDKTINRLEHYRYSNYSQYNPISINRQIGNLLHKPIYRYPNRPQDSSHEGYRGFNRSKNWQTGNLLQNLKTIYHYPHPPQDSSYEGYRGNNRSKYNRDSSYSHHNTDLSYRTEFDNNPTSRDLYRLRFDSNHKKTNSYPSKHDLMLSHYTVAPVFSQTTNNERYELKDEEPRHKEFIDKSRSISTARDDHRLNMESKMRQNYFNNDNRDLKKHYEDTVDSRNHHADIKGFHERLERVDNWRDEAKDDKKERECCETLNLASRQQQALNAMKTRYDDTHFKNFLKTQQKVNDMLEKMLSSKNSGPRSVEII
ncbi:unnamed protein product [Chilo suppressalis]|uniref:Uncharacterized protein n=1 Tax=Chilo suppressalis TaxID=168631 RepID=A0ABN8L770_CHISP|nr:unnamed protein product [Chilo suppressalis]